MNVSADFMSYEKLLPEHRSLYYGGGWHEPKNGGYAETLNPGLGVGLGDVAIATKEDVDAAVAAAYEGFKVWRDVLPLERARILKEIANIVRKNGAELATIDAANCGNPVAEMMMDARFGAGVIDFFAGLVTEMKGSTIPQGPDGVNYSVRQPFGVTARILAFNHPFMFCAGKIGAPLAAGNSVIMKPPVQAPLSALRLAELLEGLLPAGVFNVLPGDVEAGASLASHLKVGKVTLIGSVSAGRAVMKAASDTVKSVLLELGGKNALIGFADSDPKKVAEAIVGGMNFTWCGQSCGSTSRAFLHKDIHDEVVKLVGEAVSKFKPGIPTDPATTMGAIISKKQHERVMSFIESAKKDGARVVAGGKVPDDESLSGGNFIEPTIFSDVTPEMRIAKEEVFGPVLAIRKWDDEAAMIEEVNALEYGLTCAIWTRDLATAHRVAMQVEVGHVWINDVSRHFLGAPFGGAKQSGIGREDCIEELLAFTQEKAIHINLVGQ